MTTIPKREFAKPTQISKHLFCPICIEVFTNPYRLFCGYFLSFYDFNSISHTFCKNCITTWANNHQNCPVCREYVEENLAGKDLIANKIIQDLEVFCPNRICCWKDRLEEFPKHYKICSKTQIPDYLKEAQNTLKAESEEDPVLKDIYLQDVKKAYFRNLI